MELELKAKNFLLMFAFMALFVCVPRFAEAQAPIRIDASSDAAVERSMTKMMGTLDAGQQQQLQIAILQLNYAGVSSAKQIVGNPDLEHPTAAKVKDRIAGKTAEEIIDLARRTATTKVTVAGQEQEPGLPPEATRPLKKGAPAFPIAASRWRFVESANGYTSTYVFDFRADGSAIDEAHADNSAGTSSWEQSADEVRVFVNNKYAFFIGRVVDANTMTGTGGNKTGAAWTWSAERL